eukprot:INCI14380.2.p1 GENE.INCI14380.2~~INCI14380.2.p1  ORF type:complete len:432 (-),score=61.02 INCI14380.2:1245-2540(-)
MSQKSPGVKLVSGSSVDMQAKSGPNTEPANVQTAVKSLSDLAQRGNVAVVGTTTTNNNHNNNSETNAPKTATTSTPSTNLLVRPRRVPLPRGVSVIGRPGPGKPSRYGVRLRFARIQVRVGSRFCSVEAADLVAQAFRDVVTFAPNNLDATLDETKLCKYEDAEVECFTKYKSTREKVPIATLIRQWLKTWVARGQQKRKRKLLEDAGHESWALAFGGSYPHHMPYPGGPNAGAYTQAALPDYAQVGSHPMYGHMPQNKVMRPDFGMNMYTPQQYLPAPYHPTQFPNASYQAMFGAPNSAPRQGEASGQNSQEGPTMQQQMQSQTQQQQVQQPQTTQQQLQQQQYLLHSQQGPPGSSGFGSHAYPPPAQFFNPYQYHALSLQQQQQLQQPQFSMNSQLPPQQGGLPRDQTPQPVDPAWAASTARSVFLRVA